MGTECILERVGDDLEKPGQSLYRCTVCGREHSSGFLPHQIHLVCRSGQIRPEQGHSLTRGRVVGQKSPVDERQVAELEDAAEALGLRFDDVKHWTASLWRWNKAGRPVRTQEEADAIVAICQSNQCGKYITEWGGRCKKCGCRVHNGTIAVTNKALMATEHCPLTKVDKPIDHPLW